MNEQDFDYLSVEIKEPSGKLRFSSWKSLVDHVIKHVVEKYKEEKWRLLDGFDASTIREVDLENPESSELRLLIRKYIALIRETAIQACTEGRDHLHQVAFYPLKTMKMYGTDDPEPAQFIIIQDFSTKLLFVLASNVRNGVSSPYVIITAYRVFPHQPLHSWKIHTRGRVEELSFIRDGKKFVQIADHMNSENNKEMES